MSYPDGKRSITGYTFEPWHFRYVGKNAALDVHDQGITLYEWFDKCGVRLR